jgi:hypothetical protein
MTTMKAASAAAAMTNAGAKADPLVKRFLVERTFPAGALDGVDAAAKQKVNANNRSLGVTWEKSYANATKTKTFCIYTAPNENAVLEAAKLNGLPVDVIIPIPDDIVAEPRGAVHQIAAGNHRYLVRRNGPVLSRGEGDREFGVRLLTSYGDAIRNVSYWVYEAPNFSAVESAARASREPFESIVEIPVTLYPN